MLIEFPIIMKQQLKNALINPEHIIAINEKGPNETYINTAGFAYTCPMSLEEITHSLSKVMEVRSICPYTAPPPNGTEPRHQAVLMDAVHNFTGTPPHTR